MNCYYHPAVNAVAICKSCGRALCRDCIAEVGLGCSCRGRCEADVATLNDLVERGRTVYQKNGAVYTRTAIFVTTLGAIFVALGVVGATSDAGSEWRYGMLLLGLLFVGWGLSLFVAARRLSEK